MFEHRSEPLLSRAAFVRRVMGHGAVALALVVFSLFLGMAGYHLFERLSWLDAFLNAAMLLGGMGPINTTFQSPAGKLFAGLYALYAGLVFITVAGILSAPLVHRLLHRFHWEADNPEDEDKSG
jgi:hypothetical protein